MPLTETDFLPKEEELDTPDLNISSAALRAGAHHFGKYCDNVCKEFMLCHAEEKDPRKCYKEGNEVSKCALEFFQKVKSNCYEEFTKYFQCMDFSGTEIEYKNCRETQKVYDQCIFEKLGQVRPEMGYFSKARVHHTDRPRPKHVLELPERTPGPPPIDSVPPPETTKQGTRWVFM